LPANLARSANDDLHGRTLNVDRLNSLTEAIGTVNQRREQ
jgi:hypothetical protein